MNINSVDLIGVTFKGQRQDRNTVSQLKRDNDYDLNLPNQRRINEAIENLAKIRGEENVKFLLDVSNNLRYGTNINLDNKKSYNEWKSKLDNAAKIAVYASDWEVQRKYIPVLKQMEAQKAYTEEENAILREREELLKKIDFDKLKALKNKNLENVGNNLDYFVISSEVPTAQKLYILKRLNHFMSDDYVINPQLSNEKNRVLAEIINDIVINTPESEFPNSKEINQLHHGMCASISICRKDLAYEDKANYVDMVMSELDNNDNLMIYDTSKLGSHTKVPVQKPYIDFKTAMARGYRVVDTAAMYWMNVADKIGANNESYGFYSPIDINYFDTFTDSHLMNDISKDLAEKHDYYRGLVKAKSIIAEYKAQVEKEKFLKRKSDSEMQKNLFISNANNNLLKSYIYELAGENTFDKQIAKVLSDLRNLEVKNSDKLKKVPDNFREYSYLPNEEKDLKEYKISNYLQAVFPNSDKNKIDALSEKMTELLEDLSKASGVNSNVTGKKLRNARTLYEAAASYRTQQILQLSIPEHRKTLMMRFHLPNRETKLMENMDSLIEKIGKGTLKPEIQSKLAANLGVDNDPEVLAAILSEMKNQVELVTTDAIDKFYHSITMADRYHALANEIKDYKNQLDLPENRRLVQEIADDLNLNPTKHEIEKYEKKRKEFAKLSGKLRAKMEEAANKEDVSAKTQKENEELFIKVENLRKELADGPLKRKVKQYLQSKIDLLESGECTQEEYKKIFDDMGLESYMTKFTEDLDKIGKLMFHEKCDNVIHDFNLLNGVPEDADIEQTKQIYLELAKSFNNVEELINQYHRALFIFDESNNDVLNHTDVRYDIVKKLEDLGEIPRESELKAFKRRFDQIDKLLADKNNDIKSYSDLPKAYTTLSPMEKAALKQYRNNINEWYAVVNRRLLNQYRDFKEPLENHARKIGVKSGNYWVPQEGNSGLYSSQEVRIIEHMTDRPYYIEENGQRAFDNIRNGVYSGISSTSVDHTRPAMHAQYIADIAPVTLKNGETKYVVFHDNSWGASEFENVWTDKNGFVRTDYARDFGGELGYITNSKYLNGNIQENILDKVGETKPEIIEDKLYKKIVNGGGDEFRFPLLSDVIAPGMVPHVAQSAGSLKNTFLINPYQSLPALKVYANSMTKAQIKKAMERGDNAGKGYDKDFDDFMKKIVGTRPFDKGISTFEEYKNLPKNNPIRLMLDKIAVSASYDNSTIYKDYSYVKNADDIEKIKNKIEKEAIKDFYYVFGKNSDIKNYITYSSNKEIASAIDDWVSRYDIQSKPKELLPVIKNMKNVKNSDFDGSMLHTITSVVSNFKKDMVEVTPDFENKDEKIDELANEVRAILIKNNYLSESEEINMPNIEKWIDSTFAPTTNEEFIRIFNDLRDLTTKEFESLYRNKITKEALGIENITGYDMLKRLRAENDEAVNILYNQIYRDKLFGDIETGETKAHYDYNKFKREKSSTVTYVKEKTFDDIYTDYSSAISLLHLDKLFNKYKDTNYKKYGVMPGYPLVRIRDIEDIEGAFKNMFDKLDDYMTYIYSYDSQIISMEIVDDLNEILAKYNKNDLTLSYDDFSEVSDLMEDFVTANLCDETLQDLSDEITKITDSGEMSVAVYRYLTDKIYDKIKAFQTTAYGDTMEEAKEEALKNLKASKEDMLKQLFEPRYQSKAAEILDKWISARIKLGRGNESKAEEADKYYDMFIKYYDKHSIVDKPEKLLEEFLLMNAKDSELMSGNISEAKKKELEERNEELYGALRGVLVKANLVELQMQIMSYKRQGKLNLVADAFKNSQIELIDGSFVPVASPDGLSILFSSLLTKENAPILIDFFNELGLSETFALSIVDDEQFSDARKNINRMHSILKSFDSQVKFINKHLEAMSGIDNDENYEKTLKEFKKKLDAKIKRSNYREPMGIYDAAIDEILKKIASNPDMSKYLIMNSAMYAATNGITKNVKNNLNVLSDDLKRLGEIQRIMVGLKLPENSEAKKQADKFLQECQDLIGYQASFPTYYPNSEISVS